MIITTYEYTGVLVPQHKVNGLTILLKSYSFLHLSALILMRAHSKRVEYNSKYINKERVDKEPLVK